MWAMQWTNAHGHSLFVHSFQYLNYTAQNYIATQQGYAEQGQNTIIDRHYDCVNNGPGADDNLSAVLAMLEASRILSIMPNPAHETALIKIPEEMQAREIQLISSKGDIVYCSSAQSREHIIFTECLPAGTYVVNWQELGERLWGGWLLSCEMWVVRCELGARSNFLLNSQLTIHNSQLSYEFNFDYFVYFEYFD